MPWKASHVSIHFTQRRSSLLIHSKSPPSVFLGRSLVKMWWKPTWFLLGVPQRPMAFWGRQVLCKSCQNSALKKLFIPFELVHFVEPPLTAITTASLFWTFRDFSFCQFYFPKYLKLSQIGRCEISHLDTCTQSALGLDFDCAIQTQEHALI